jgi:hypothetical protein
MLRTVVLAIAVICAATGAWLWSSGITRPGIEALCVGAIVALGIVFERWRYKEDTSTAAAHWQPTGERFTDPTTGKNMEVLYDPASGERRYVER